MSSRLLFYDFRHARSRRVSAQQRLALLRRNDVGAARGLVVRAGHALRSDRLGRVAANSRSEDDNLRAGRGAVVKIDNVIIGQTDAAG